MWQQPSSLPCGDHISDLALFRILTTEAGIPKNKYVDAHLLKVPYEDLSKCIGLRQVYLTNAYIWLPIHSIVDIAIVTHAQVIQNSYCQFGGKGVHNSYFLLFQIRYNINKKAEVELTSRTIHHSHFSSFANSNSLSLSHFSPSFNHRIYSSLGSLRDAINKLMHTKRMFQRNGYTMNHYLSAESWVYLCDRLRGGMWDNGRGGGSGQKIIPFRSSADKKEVFISEDNHNQSRVSRATNRDPSRFWCIIRCGRKMCSQAFRWCASCQSSFRNQLVVPYGLQNLKH